MIWPKLELTLQFICGPFTHPGVLKTSLLILKCGLLVSTTQKGSMKFSLFLIDRHGSLMALNSSPGPPPITILLQSNHNCLNIEARLRCYRKVVVKVLLTHMVCRLVQMHIFTTLISSCIDQRKQASCKYRNRMFKIVKISPSAESFTSVGQSPAIISNPLQIFVSIPSTCEYSHCTATSPLYLFLTPPATSIRFLGFTSK